MRTIPECGPCALLARTPGRGVEKEADGYPARTRFGISSSPVLTRGLGYIDRSGTGSLCVCVNFSPKTCL